MASIINADSGISSSVTGITFSADNSGALNIQTNGVTAIAISSSQAVSFPATTSLNFGSANISNLTATTLTVSASTYLATASGSVGIGTATPSEKLEVAGAVKLTAGNLSVAPSTATNAAVTICSNTGGTFFAGLDSSTGSSFGVGNYSSVLYNGANTPMVFFTNATERMRLSSGGNLGIGTASPGQKLEVAGNILINTSGNPYMEVKTSGAGNNPYLKLTADTNNWIVQGTFSNTNDELMFQYNSSTLMTLDKNGNLGVGTSSVFDSNTRLELSKSGNCQQFISSTDASGVRIYLSAFSSTVGNIGTFSNHPLLLKTNDAERVRITAGGLVGIGNSSPSNSQAVITGISAYTANTYFALRLNAGSYADSGSYTTMIGFGVENAAWSKGAIGYTRTGSYDTGYLAFYLNGSANTDMVAIANEKARITNDGYLLVGTTSSIASYGPFQGVSSTAGQYLARHTSASSGLYWRFGAEASNNVYIVYNQNGNGVYVTDGGTSWTGNSDERMKTDLKPIENASAKVSTLRAVTGRFHTDDKSKSRSFLIAQDVQKVLPEAVDSQNPDKLGLAYTDVIPLLVAAIKEQTAMINDLKAKVAALEGV